MVGFGPWQNENVYPIETVGAIMRPSLDHVQIGLEEFRFLGLDSFNGHISTVEDY
jgi:hypothetical protein